MRLEYEYRAPVISCAVSDYTRLSLSGSSLLTWLTSRPTCMLSKLGMMHAPNPLSSKSFKFVTLPDQIKQDFL